MQPFFLKLLFSWEGRLMSGASSEYNFDGQLRGLEGQVGALERQIESLEVQKRNLVQQKNQIINYSRNLDRESIKEDQKTLALRVAKDAAWIFFVMITLYYSDKSPIFILKDFYKKSFQMVGFGSHPIAESSFAIFSMFFLTASIYQTILDCKKIINNLKKV